LSKDGVALDFRVDHEKNSHARKVTVLVEELLNTNNVTYEQLDAIAVSEGPGSYTGLRIGVSAAKGYCYALNKPLIAVPTLQIIAQGIKQQTTDSIFYLALIDARRMDVYAALYTKVLDELLGPGFFTLNEDFAALINFPCVAVGGDATAKSKEILAGKDMFFTSGVVPVARLMTALAENKFNNEDFADVAYFEPMYINEFQAKLPKAQ
jgi:tRNA threonylcarbamoyladenosine biosynthesis protein TsaB